MTLLHGIFILVFLKMVSNAQNIRQHSAAIEAVPPRVSLTPIDEKQNADEMINIDPFLTSSLLQAVAEENEETPLSKFEKRMKMSKMLLKEGFLLV